MDVKDKLQYLMDNMGAGHYKEIRQLYKEVRGRNEASECEDKVKSEVLWMDYEVRLERQKLVDLQKGLSEYLGDRGLEDSILKMSELERMVSNDVREVKSKSEDINELLRIMKEKESKEEEKDV